MIEKRIDYNEKDEKKDIRRINLYKNISDDEEKVLDDITMKIIIINGNDNEKYEISKINLINLSDLTKEESHNIENEYKNAYIFQNIKWY